MMTRTNESFLLLMATSMARTCLIQHTGERCLPIGLQKRIQPEPLLAPQEETLQPVRHIPSLIKPDYVHPNGTLLSDNDLRRVFAFANEPSSEDIIKTSKDVALKTKMNLFLKNFSDISMSGNEKREYGNLMAISKKLRELLLCFNQYTLMVPHNKLSEKLPEQLQKSLGDLIARCSLNDDDSVTTLINGIQKQIDIHFPKMEYPSLTPADKLENELDEWVLLSAPGQSSVAGHAIATFSSDILGKLILKHSIIHMEEEKDEMDPRIEKLVTDAANHAVWKPVIEDGRNTKKSLHLVQGLEDLPYSILCITNDDSSKSLFVLCPGEKKQMRLGAGAYGNAKLFQCLSDENQIFGVIKTAKPVDEKDPEELKGSAANEALTMKILSQSTYNMVKFYGSYERHNSDHSLYEILMGEAIGKNPKKYFSGAQPVPVVDCRNFACGLIDNLSHLHANGFVHCDIKADNCQFDPVYGKVLLLDFGMACKIGSDSRMKGTPGYIAPEHRLGGTKTPFAASSDVYSLGVTLGTVFGLGSVRSYSAIDSRFAFYPEEKCAEYSSLRDSIVREKLKILISEMLSENPQDRPSLEAAKNDIQKIFMEAPHLSDPVNVGILDFKSFQESDPEARQHAIQKMQEFDRVCLVIPSESGCTQLSVEQTIQWLESRGITVIDRVIHADDINQCEMIAMELLPELMQHPVTCKSVNIYPALPKESSDYDDSEYKPSAKKGRMANEPAIQHIKDEVELSGLSMSGSCSFFQKKDSIKTKSNDETLTEKNGLKRKI